VAPNRKDLEVAVEAYWATKEAQLATAEAIASRAEGAAKEVRAGRQFTAIATLIARFFTDAGYPPESIATSGRRTVLPGYFRASKAWDLAVIHKNVVVAAIEFKALGRRSPGNNFNNRVEEALGNAVDAHQANIRNLVGTEKPWLGYFFVIEDSEKSRRPVERGHENLALPNAPEWGGLSYEERFSITGRRFIDEGLYDAVCFVASSPDSPAPTEPEPLLDWRHFSASIEARLTFLAGLGLP
jgi:Restriction endonuclease XhoI